MSTLSLNIQMAGKMAVIIGGGTVALRKTRTLLAAGAAVYLVASEIHPEIIALKSSDNLTIKTSNFIESDLDGAFLVIAATDSSSTNREICKYAKDRGSLVVSAENPEIGDCTFPAVLRRGNLEIAVSTGGRSPSFAADVRNKIAENIGHEYGTILEQMYEEREKLLTNGNPSTYNEQVLRSLTGRLIAELTERKESSL